MLSHNGRMASPRFTMRQLEIFVALAQTGNLTRAAEKLHLSPSAASAAITELERSIGADLCVRRKGRGVQLTTEGRIFEQRATRLLDEAIEMGNLVSQSTTGNLHGTLRLGYYLPVAAAFLPHLLQNFTS